MSTTKELQNKVAEEIRAGMTRRRMTQATLAHKIGISRVSLSERLNGQRAFDTDHLFAISEALGIDLLALFPPMGDESKAAS